jgi:hypothetical protein
MSFFERCDIRQHFIGGKTNVPNPVLFSSATGDAKGDFLVTRLHGERGNERRPKYRTHADPG